MSLVQVIKISEADQDISIGCISLQHCLVRGVRFRVSCRNGNVHGFENSLWCLFKTVYIYQCLLYRAMYDTLT